MGKSKQMFMDQRESETVDSANPTPVQDRTFTTIIGTRFVDFNNVTEIELDGKIHAVDRVIVKHCSVMWALRFHFETWGVKSIAVRPVIVKVDAVAAYVLNNAEKEIEIHFEFIPEMSNVEIDTNEFNPLVNGIVPTGVEIKINEGEPANVKIKY